MYIATFDTCFGIYLKMARKLGTVFSHGWRFSPLDAAHSIASLVLPHNSKLLLSLPCGIASFRNLSLLFLCIYSFISHNVQAVSGRRRKYRKRTRFTPREHFPVSRQPKPGRRGLFKILHNIDTLPNPTYSSFVDTDIQQQMEEGSISSSAAASTSESSQNTSSSRRVSPLGWFSRQFSRPTSPQDSTSNMSPRDRLSPTVGLSGGSEGSFLFRGGVGGRGGGFRPIDQDEPEEEDEANTASESQQSADNIASEVIDSDEIPRMNGTPGGETGPTHVAVPANGDPSNIPCPPVVAEDVAEVELAGEDSAVASLEGPEVSQDDDYKQFLGLFLAAISFLGNLAGGYNALNENALEAFLFSQGANMSMLIGAARLYYSQEEMKKRIENIQAMVTTLKPGIETANQLTAYFFLPLLRGVENGTDEEQKKAIENAVSKLFKLPASLKALEESVKALKANVKALEASVSKLATKDEIKGLARKIQDIDDAVDGLASKKDIDDAVEGLASDIATLRAMLASVVGTTIEDSSENN